MIQPQISQWNAFWFSPAPITSLQFVRRALCVVVAIYFASALGDVSTWFTRGAPASSSNLATFFRTSELTSDARWMVSPLFIWDAIFEGSALAESALIYRSYLLLGIVLAVIVAFADRLNSLELPHWVSPIVSGSWLSWLLWLWFVGWANRVVLLAGVFEPVLSVSLAALAIAPIGQRPRSGGGMARESWRAGFSLRLLSVQATLIALITTATLLASTAWWNGTGAYALAAPSEDRLFSVTDTLFERPLVYELMTLLIVGVLPIGILLAWRPKSRSIGVGMIITWCCVVGLLSANILYAATLAIISTAIGAGHSNHTPAGANGAETLDGGSVETDH